MKSLPFTSSTVFVFVFVFVFVMFCCLTLLAYDHMCTLD